MESYVNTVLYACTINPNLKILIGPRAVLTSAHCLPLPLHIYIIAGQQSIDLKLLIESASTAEGQIMKVTMKKVHEKFYTESQYDYDMALASFKRELQFGGMAT